MAYDFTTIMERSGQDALAVDGLGAGAAPEPPEPGWDFIPMWVADMNFPVCPSITEAVARRVAQPHFGYFRPRDEYFRSIISWHERRHGLMGLEPRHIGYENGVLGGLVSALRACASPGDFVLLHSPTYIGFTGSIEGAGFRIALSPLKRDADGVWRMDYDDMDRVIREHGIRVAVFCSPHNPTGRVWERSEIERAMEVYRRNGCVVVSDEIWSDIVLPGSVHVPTQSVSADARERTIALHAPSKTFNLAGLIGSYHIIFNDRLRERVESEGAKTHYNSMNVLSMHALIGAYGREGGAWADELCRVIAGNVDLACGFIAERFDGVEVARPQGTYMLFLDCTAWCASHGTSIGELLRAGWRVGVGWQDGRPFHGPCHIRVNLALPRARVEEALRRLDEHVFNAR